MNHCYHSFRSHCLDLWQSTTKELSPLKGNIQNTSKPAEKMVAETFKTTSPWTRTKLAFMAILLASAPTSFADDWNTGTADWFVDANWLDGSTPTAADDVFIDNGGTPQIGSGGAVGLNIFVGHTAGSGTMAISSGGDLSSDFGRIGFDNTDTNTVTVDGTGATWTIANTLTIGESNGNGVLNISDGGNVSTVMMTILSGEATVAGTGSQLTVSSGAINALAIANGSVLNIGNGGTTGNVSVGNITGAGTINVNNTDSTTLAAALQNTLSVTKAGSGILALNGNSSHSGDTSLNAGSIAIGHNNALGTGTLNIADDTTLATDGNPRRITNTMLVNGDFRIFPEGTTVSVSAFELDGDIDLAGGNRTITNPSEFSAFEFGQVSLGGVISNGSLSLSDNGFGPGLNVVFFAMDGTQANTYTGNTTVQTNVSLQLAKSANITAIPGDISIQQESVVVIVNDEQIADTATVTLANTGQLQVGNGGAVTETITSIMDDGSGQGVIDLDGAGSTLAVASGDYSGSIIGGQAASTSLTKYGSGMLTLSGAATYAGDTAVNNGTLLVNNTSGSATGTGNVTVASGSTLGGDGTIGGSVNVADGATIAAGNSPGTLTVGELLLNNASVLEFELGSPAGTAGVDSDLIVVDGGSGNLTLDGTLDIIDWGGYGAGTYRLINYTGSLTDNGLDIGTQPAGFNAVLDTGTPGEVNLVVSSTATAGSPYALPIFGLPGLGLLALLLSLTGMRFLSLRQKQH